MGDSIDITPRCLSADDASRYIGVSLNTFLRMVAGGKAPKPISISERRRVWDRKILDQFIDDLGKSDSM